MYTCICISKALLRAGHERKIQAKLAEAGHSTPEKYIVAYLSKIELKVSPRLGRIITRISKIFNKIHQMIVNWAGTWHNIDLISSNLVVNSL